MTHTHQIALRYERIHLIQFEIRRKETDKISILCLQIKDNIITEEKLCETVGDYGVSQALIVNL